MHLSKKKSEIYRFTVSVEVVEFWLLLRDLDDCHRVKGGENSMQQPSRDEPNPVK